MDKLLTTKQVQEYLKVDRITVYRMLNDGRVKGVKVGNHWRFTQAEISRLLGELPQPEEVAEDSSAVDLSDFPIDCVERLQEVFAGILGVGAVTVNLQGEAITRPFFSNPFCQLMLASPSGCKACQQSWRKIATRITGHPEFYACHAGLGYLRSPVKMNGQTIAWMVTGQLYASQPSAEATSAKLQELSAKHQIPLADLEEAAREIPVLKRAEQLKVQEWAPRVADTVQSMLCERSDLVNRLERIAEISSVKSSLVKKPEK